jgi:hypothetical protein
LSRILCFSYAFSHQTLIRRYIVDEVENIVHYFPKTAFDHDGIMILNKLGFLRHMKDLAQVLCPVVQNLYEKHVSLSTVQALVV